MAARRKKTACIMWCETWFLWLPEMMFTSCHCICFSQKDEKCGNIIYGTWGENYAKRKNKKLWYFLCKAKKSFSQFFKEKKKVFQFQKRNLLDSTVFNIIIINDFTLEGKKILFVYSIQVVTEHCNIVTNKRTFYKTSPFISIQISQVKRRKDGGKGQETT